MSSHQNLESNEFVRKIQQLIAEEAQKYKITSSSASSLLDTKIKPACHQNWETFLAGLGRVLDKSTEYDPPTDHLVKIERITGGVSSEVSGSVFFLGNPMTSTIETATGASSPEYTPDDQSSSASSYSDDVKEEAASPGPSSTLDCTGLDLFPWNPSVLTDIAQEITVETYYPRNGSSTPTTLDNAALCREILKRECSDLSTAEISRRFLDYINGTRKSMKFFAEAIVGVAETTLYSYLKNPAPWEQLKGKKKAYWRMANWLELPPKEQKAIMEMSVEEAATVTNVKRQRKRREPNAPRTVLTKLQKERMLDFLETNSDPTWLDMQTVAKDLGLEATQVKNFYKNLKHRQ